MKYSIIQCDEKTTFFYLRSASVARPSEAATRSRAPLVGMLRERPLTPPAKKGMHDAAFFAMIATESLGVTKKRSPTTMLRSASPSHAPPNCTSPAAASPPSLRPHASISSGAYFWFGSGWHPPKSGSGLHRSKHSAGTPSVSWRRSTAYGPGNNIH